MAFIAPVEDITFTLKHVCGLDRLIADGLYPDLSEELVDAVLREAGRFATDIVAPLNRVGDVTGTPFVGGVVRTPEGFASAYDQWVSGGWGAITGPPEYGGQGLPIMVGMAVSELWNSACMAFGLGTLLTAGAVEALSTHASETVRSVYLPKLVSGQWSGTMNLTEPQAGSDLGALRTRAQPAGDGSYRLFGSKIFITYGEHDLTENIVHLVLARLPDAPPGTRGISLFLVPKFLAGEDGSVGRRNDVRCVGVEHKLGIHASPTCTMVFGETDGAVGFLVGEENRGLACMFTMMNNARLAVGIQGVAIAERATQQAVLYAQERRQGRAPGNEGSEASRIIEHPDVRRMLLTMRALTQASRSICYACAEALDRARRETDEERRRAARARADLLTPVAKAFSTDIGVEVASLGVQVHGGPGYIEETGAAQHLRDARIAPIYEGTNGIQALDLVSRKLPLNGGETVRAAIRSMEATAERARGSNRADLGAAAERLSTGTRALSEATDWMLAAIARDPSEALSGASPYLRLFALASGGAHLIEGALAAARDSEGNGRALLARFFAENLLPQASGLRDAVIGGAGSIVEATPALLAS